MKFHSAKELIEDIRAGKMVLLVDDEDRENEGDLVLAADHVSPAAINFMAKEARGLICLALSPLQIDRLGLPLMVRDDLNFTPNKTAFTVSIEAAHGVSTGISAADRAHTIRVAASPQATPRDIHTPGHVFPIRAQEGGVLKRAGHTEGSVDLARLAGCHPAAVICEVMNEDGTMARVPELRVFAEKHGIKIGTIVDLIEHRLETETLVEEIYTSSMPMEGTSDFRVRVFKSHVDGTEHLVLQKGEVKEGMPTLVRVHSEHALRDLFSSMIYRDNPVSLAIRAIEEAGAGILVMLRDMNRPTGVAAELRSMIEKDMAVDKRGLSIDTRDYGTGAQILRAMGVSQIHLIANRPGKRVGMKAFGLEVTGVRPLGAVSEQREMEEGRDGQEAQSGAGHSPLQ